METELPTKRLAADAVSEIAFEARGKMNCHMSSLARMARRTRQAADKLTNIPATPETWSTSVSLVTTSSLTTTSARCCETLDTMRQPRAPKWIKYDQRLQKIADEFESYTNVLDYLEVVGNMTMLE